MTREELKAEALINLGSEPAPKEWKKLPEIKEQMPSCIGGEVSLQRFVGTDICAWFVGIGGLWEPQSDYFRVSLPPAEGAEEILNKAKAGGVPLTWLITPGYPAWNAILDAMREFAAQQQPTAEDAEEIEAELRGYARDIVRLHKPIMEVNPQLAMDSIGNDLVKMFNRIAQRIADKMVSERLRDAPKNCPKAAQCAHVKGGMKCPPNVICPI